MAVPVPSLRFSLQHVLYATLAVAVLLTFVYQQQQVRSLRKRATAAETGGGIGYVHYLPASEPGGPKVQLRRGGTWAEAESFVFRDLSGARISVEAKQQFLTVQVNEGPARNCYWLVIDPRTGTLQLNTKDYGVLRGLDYDYDWVPEASEESVHDYRQSPGNVPSGMVSD